MSDITKESLMNLFYAGESVEDIDAATPVGISNSEEEIPLSEIRSFGGPYGTHFFKRNEEKVEELADSIKQVGIISPIVLREDPLGENKYECLAGHTRCAAAKLAGLETIPARIIEADDDEACYIMAASNRQREELLPSEKAQMYKTEYDAIKRVSGRKKNGAPVGPHLKSIEILEQNSDDSRNQIRRYIKLTELISPLLEIVDEKKIGFQTGVELAFISTEGQKHIFSIIECDDVKVSLDMAKELRALPDGTDIDGYRAVMLPEKTEVEKTKKPKPLIKISKEIKKKYFPAEYTDAQMEAVLIKLLESWSKSSRK